MSKKVLYNIKKMKKCGGGRGQYLNQNTLYVFNKRKSRRKKKKIIIVIII